MRVFLESPYNPPSAEECAPYSRFEVARQNLVYARLAMLDSLQRGESPFASHLLFTQVWVEDGGFRERGIAAASEWRASAELSVFYVDLGMSPGMEKALRGVRSELRWLFGDAYLPGAERVTAHRRRLADMPLQDWPLLEVLRGQP